MRFDLRLALHLLDVLATLGVEVEIEPMQSP